MSLKEGQWQIGPIVFGKGTKYPIEVAPDISYGEMRVQDVPAPRGDEIFFGVDLFGANIITFEMSVFSGSLSSDLSAFNAHWQGNPVRRIPGAAVPLQYCYEGNQRQVFGRPRRMAPIPGPTGREWIRYLCDFQCIDNKFYSQTENTFEVSIQPESQGGIIAPVIAPVLPISSSSVSSTEFVVGGATDAWVKIVLNGPITAPQIELFNQWTQTMPLLSLINSETIEINSRPWERRIRRNDSIPSGGIFDAASEWLSRLTISPGNKEIVLRGTDVTQTAHMTISWFDTYLEL